MKTNRYKLFLSAFISIFLFAVAAAAGPVKFEQVVQIIDAKPGKSATSKFATLRVATTNDPVKKTGDNDGDKDKGDKDKKSKKDGDQPKSETAETTETIQQDKRVITTTTVEIAEAEECFCEEAIIEVAGGFPKWPLFGLAAVPLAFVDYGDDKSPTPTPTTPPNTATPTPTTPTPTQTPVPEPMTLILFGTGLTGVGFAARRRFGKKNKSDE